MLVSSIQTHSCVYLLFTHVRLVVLILLSVTSSPSSLPPLPPKTPIDSHFLPYPIKIFAQEWMLGQHSDQQKMKEQASHCTNALEGFSFITFPSVYHLLLHPIWFFHHVIFFSGNYCGILTVYFFFFFFSAAYFLFAFPPHLSQVFHRTGIWHLEVRNWKIGISI